MSSSVTFHKEIVFILEPSIDLLHLHELRIHDVFSKSFQIGEECNTNCEDSVCYVPMWGSDSDVRVT